MASALTNQEGANWALNRIGQSIDTDGLYGAQCKDFVNAFTQENFGVTFPGNANALIYTALPAGWQRIANTPDFLPQPGDIALWDSWSGNPYGHTAIIVSANLNTFVSVDQNWINSSNNGSPAAKVTHNYTNPKFWGVLRPPYNSNEDVPHEDLGTDFYALILNTELWKPVVVSDNGNVVMDSEKWIPNEYWRFFRQNDGSYKILSAYNGRRLDLQDNNPNDQTNIKTWDDNNSDAQRWYITKKGNGYQIRGKSTNCVMEMNAPNYFDGVNICSGFNHGVSAEIFSIYKDNWNDVSLSTIQAKVEGTEVNFTWDSKPAITNYNIKIWKENISANEADYCYWNVKGNSFKATLPPGTYEAVVQSYNALGHYNQSAPKRFSIESYADLGNVFYGTIVNTGTDMALAVSEDNNVELKRIDGSSSQFWKFERQDDLSYKITSEKNGLCLDLSRANTENGTNILVFSSHDENNQRWYFIEYNGSYNIESKCGQDAVVDVTGGHLTDGTNIEIFAWNGSNAQQFTINMLLLGDVTGDKNISLSDVLEMQKHLANIVKLSDIQQKCGDIDGNGNITVSDVINLQKFIAQIKSEYPIGQIIK